MRGCLPTEVTNIFLHNRLALRHKAMRDEVPRAGCVCTSLPECSDGIMMQNQKTFNRRDLLAWTIDRGFQRPIFPVAYVIFLV